MATLQHFTCRQSGDDAHDPQPEDGGSRLQRKGCRNRDPSALLLLHAFVRKLRTEDPGLGDVAGPTLSLLPDCFSRLELPVDAPRRRRLLLGRYLGTWMQCAFPAAVMPHVQVATTAWMIMMTEARSGACIV